jgi:hypothetical protein
MNEVIITGSINKCVCKLLIVWINSLRLPFFMDLYIKNIRPVEYFIGKTTLFKFKILIKVILKHKLQRKGQQVEST